MGKELLVDRRKESLSRVEITKTLKNKSLIQRLDKVGTFPALIGWKHGYIGD